ncbi:MAG TPA: F0F1 ATP synthase subunit B, partial [Micromonosporaceae bacterium]|nr:F0F1 ATP synthase subunit B [Micromonosporaceae bacterium]
MRYLAAVLAQEAPADEPNPILPIWQELVVGIIAFGLLCWVLMKYVFPRMEATFKARVEAIEGGIQRAEAAQAEANATLARYQ